MIDFLNLNPAPNWKTGSHVLKNTPGQFKTLELADT